MRWSNALWTVGLCLGLLAAADRVQDPEPGEPGVAYPVVRGTAFELVDAEGVVRARLGLDEGEPALRLFDAERNSRVRLFWSEQGGGLYLDDPDGTTRLGAALFEHGGAGFALHGLESKGAAVLYWKDDGRLSFYDEEGRVTARFPSQGR